MKQTIRAAIWGFFWGYLVVFILCMTVLLIGMGTMWPGLDGLLHIAGNVFFSNAQYVFLGVGVVTATCRAYYGGNDYADMNFEDSNEEDGGIVEETIESLWED